MNWKERRKRQIFIAENVVHHPKQCNASFFVTSLTKNISQKEIRSTKMFLIARLSCLLT